MGTNFYAQKRMTQEQRNKFCEYIENNEVLKADSFLEELKKMTEKIHIGKRSSGWKFLWDCHNFEYFAPSKESLMEFLKSVEITNEYKEVFTFEEFINNELDGFIDEGYDIETYYRDKGGSIKYKHYVSQNIINEYNKNFGINVNPYGEFHIEDLRFTVDEDFR